MGVKEAAIVGGILGGAGGAGGAYAADLGGIRTGGNGGRAIEKRFEFTPLDCLKALWTGVLDDDLNKDFTGSEPITFPNEDYSFEAKKGCLKIKLSPEDANGQRKLDVANFELVIEDSAESGKSNKGLVIWSTLSKGRNNDLLLISRAFYLGKEGEDTNKKWTAKAGLQFTHKLDVSKAKLSGLDQEWNLQKLFNGDAAESEKIDTSKSKYEWTSGSDKKDCILGKVDIKKIDKDSSGLPLFGRDLNVSDKDSVTSVYVKGKGWKRGKDGITVKPLLKGELKGKWESK